MADIQRDDFLLKLISQSNLIEDFYNEDIELKEILLKKIKSNKKYELLIKNLDSIESFVKFDSGLKAEPDKYYIMYPITKSGLILDDITDVHSMIRLKSLLQLVGNNQKQRLVIPYSNLYKIENTQECEIQINKDLEIIKKSIIKICNIKKEFINVINDRTNDIVLSTYNYYVNNTDEQKMIREKIFLELLYDRNFEIINSILTGIENSKYSEYFCKYPLFNRSQDSINYSINNNIYNNSITITTQILDKLESESVKYTKYNKLESESVKYTKYNKLEQFCKEIIEELLNKPFERIKHPDFINPLTNYPLELDLYNDELKLAIEYNGPQHYRRLSHWQTEEDFDKQLYRDKLKEEFANKYDINLIIIPEITNKQLIKEYIICSCIEFGYISECCTNNNEDNNLKIDPASGDIKNFIDDIKIKKPEWYKEQQEIPISNIRKNFDKFTNNKYGINHKLTSLIGKALGTRRRSNSFVYIRLNNIDDL